VQAEKTLVVDLDGTLVRSDMLYESFWAALSQSWVILPGVIAALLRGRAALKRFLAARARMDYSCLPYAAEVLTLIDDWRASGGRVVLVTATDQIIANGIADHLGLFDEVHGSDGTTNLGGAQKAAFLAHRFGAQGFVYVGDRGADLPVWAVAAGAVTVNASPRLRARVETGDRPVEHLGNPQGAITPILKEIRPHQWLKNVLVFLPMALAHQFSLPMLAHSMMAFIGFCLVASTVYVLNDLLDLSSDRAHPRKRMRPIASGALSARRATAILPLLLLAGLGVALLSGVPTLLVVLGYFITTTAYSLYFKHKIVADICILAGFYTLRIIAGSVAAGTVLSVWLLAFSIFFFLSLAAVKRQAELVDGIAHGRYSFAGRGYRAGDLPIVAGMAITAGYVSIMVLALYINSPDVQQLYQTPNVLWGICLVLLYWIGRIVMTAHRGKMTDDPIVFATHDRASQACLVLILCFAVGGVVL
jgi:4-hydroxybenzoate polyprenyltransferase/phosphoserine phosphatase